MTKTKTAPAETPKGRYVLVTTAHRGVFVGYAEDTTGETITLHAARCVLYWPMACRGFLGLASHGPLNGSRVGPPADLSLRAITSVVEVTPAARELFEAEPWA